MQHDWFMYHLRSTYKNRLDFPFNCDKWGLILCRIFFSFFWYIIQNFLENLLKNLSCGRQKGSSMMTRYARSYSLQKGPSLEDSVE